MHSETFSEVYLLGPNHMAQDLPFNVALGQNYSVYLGVGNHLDSAAYYVCYVKLRNQTDPLPNQNDYTPSDVEPVCEYRAIVEKGANWTTLVSFSLNYISVSNNQTLLQSITINNVQYTVNKMAQFDQDNNGYYYQILIELWAYYPVYDVLSYQNRYVYFWLNATSSTSV